MQPAAAPDPREAHLRDALEWALCAHPGIAWLMQDAPALDWDSRRNCLHAALPPRSWTVRSLHGLLVVERVGSGGPASRSIVLPRDLRDDGGGP